jgi:oligosaccharide repeat unit polymerase
MFFLLNPIFLFFMGTFIGLTPYIFDSKYFHNYSTFVFTYEILVVYFIGSVSFIFGVLTMNIIYKNKNFNIFKIYKKDLNIIISFLIIISLLVFVKIISLYGSLPLLSLLIDVEDIGYVNQIQKDVGGGIFGVFFLIVIGLIIFFPYSVINKNKSFINKILFFVHLPLLVIYTTYSGKRQMMFIFFIYTFSYLLLFYTKTNNEEILSKVKRAGIISFILLIGMFLTIGLIRSNLTNNDISIFDPIIHYASLPFINLTSIISNQESNSFAYTFTALYEIIFKDLPTFIRVMIFDNFETLNMPLIEPTSPPTIYGEVFWSFGYIGVFLYLLVVGMFSSYLYLKAIYNKDFIYITFYSLIVWPLLSIHTYNHFKNFMFLIIPIILIILGNKIYNKIPKKKDKLVSTY